EQADLMRVGVAKQLRRQALRLEEFEDARRPVTARGIVGRAGPRRGPLSVAHASLHTFRQVRELAEPARDEGPQALASRGYAQVAVSFAQLAVLVPAPRHERLVQAVCLERARQDVELVIGVDQ